ncbi:MAG: helix-turn-helix domain-containing protein, partial [Kiritimatiellia bacterium]
MAKKKEDRNGAAYAAPAVDMALDLVEFLAENPGAFGINDLSRRLGLAVNSVYRVLRRLAARGYVELDPASSGYQLSTRFISLGMKLNNRI